MKSQASGKYFILLIVLFFGIGIHRAMAQKRIQVLAHGSYVSRDMTPEQTLQKAIEEAKRNAMKKAGIAETVSMTDFLYQFEDNEDFREIFQAFTATEIGAEIILDSILGQSRHFDEYGNMVVDVDIQATVFKHKSKADPSFDFRIQGIDKYYNQGDNMLFSFTPSADGYLKIFNVTPKGASILYPYKNEDYPYLNDSDDMHFEKGTQYRFPLNKAFDHGYTLEIEDAEQQEEFNLLIFAYTRRDIPFFNNPDVQSIMRWIYDIPPDERSVKQEGFIIKK